MHGNSSEVDIEVRIRTIYLIKSLIYAGVKESECSSEAATLLIESCEYALEEPDISISIWNHVKEIITNNYMLKLVNTTMDWPVL